MKFLDSYKCTVQQDVLLGATCRFFLDTGLGRLIQRNLLGGSPSRPELADKNHTWRKCELTLVTITSILFLQLNASATGLGIDIYRGVSVFQKRRVTLT